MQKKALSLITVFIILIVVIVLASLTAAILFMNTESMRSAASTKARDISSMASTSFITVKLSGDDGSDEQLENFYHQIKLQPGSVSVSLSSLLVLVELDDATAELSPGQGPCVHDAAHAAQGSNGFWTDNSSRGYYTYHLLKNTSNTKEGLFQEGEILELCYELPRPVTHYDDLYIRLKAGNTIALAEPVAVPFVLERVVRLKG